MNFNLFSLITTYLFAFALALPAAEEQGIAKRSVNGQSLLTQINGLVTSCNKLNSFASSCKQSKSTAGQDFQDLASSCKSSAEGFRSACGSYDNPLFPVAGLVNGIFQLIAIVVDLIVSVGLWVLAVGIEIVFDVVELVALLVLDILEGFQLIINGGNWAFWGAAFPCSSAIALCKSFCNMHGIQY